MKKTLIGIIISIILIGCNSKNKTKNSLQQILKVENKIKPHIIEKETKKEEKILSIPNKSIDVKDITIKGVDFFSSIEELQERLGKPENISNDYNGHNDINLKELNYPGLNIVFNQFKNDEIKLSNIRAFKGNNLDIEIKGEIFNIGTDSIKINEFSEDYKVNIPFQSNHKGETLYIIKLKTYNENTVKFWSSSSNPEIVEKDEKGLYVPQGNLIFYVKDSIVVEILIDYDFYL